MRRLLRLLIVLLAGAGNLWAYLEEDVVICLVQAILMVPCAVVVVGPWMDRADEPPRPVPVPGAGVLPVQPRVTR